MAEDCIFCKIANKIIPARVIYEDAEFMIIMDRFPWAEGHTLIILKRHAETVFELSDDECRKLSVLIRRSAIAIIESLKPDGLNVIQNNGEAAGQSVRHFHAHLIPRYERDGINITFPPNDPPPEKFEKVLSAIKTRFNT